MKKRATIWIIEDNAHLRNMLSEYINLSDDLECTGVFSSCETALGNLAKEPPPQILLIDLGLPGMNGIDGIRKFKEREPDIEPLVLTIDDSREKVFDAIQAGASGYLLKTADVDEILDACRKIAIGETCLDGSIARMMLNHFRRKGTDKPREKEQEAEHNLTARELEILQMLADGYYVKEIVDQLEISQRTVHFHCTNLYRKLHASSQRTAILEARRRGIL